MRVGEERDTGSKSQGLILSESENREHRSSVTLTQQKRSFAIQRGKHNSLTSAAHFLSPEWNKEEGNWGNSPTPLGPIMSVSQGVYVNPVGGGSSGHPYIHPSKPKPPKVPSLRVKLSAMNATSKVASSKVETRKIGNTVLLPRDLQFYSQFKYIYILYILTSRLYESTRAKEFGEATEPYMFLDIGGISLPPLHSPNVYIYIYINIYILDWREL